MSLSNNFFKNLTQEQSIFKASEFIAFVYAKAQEIDCNIALYNHSGWFGDINNQIEIINALPQHKLTMAYNFHHAHQYLDNLPQTAKKMIPYLASVNLNGMTIGGPKISPIGSGEFEKDMIKQLRDNGFKGPWGIMGHVENKDAKSILEQNIKGLRSLITN